MGYYSRLSVERQTRAERDRSYPTAREELVWRLEDLESRLDELTRLRKADCLCALTGHHSLDELCRAVIARTLPEDMNTPEDVLLAIEITRETLRELDGGDGITAVAVLPGQFVLASMLVRGETVAFRRSKTRNERRSVYNGSLPDDP